jgi:glycogen debranching enzyme
MQQSGLARIADKLGLKDDARIWEGRARAMGERMLKQMWDAQSGMFWAKKDGLPIQVRTPFSLFPLLTGRLPEKVVQRLVAHLTDPHEFWTRFPVPTVALNDPNFNPDQMWRGPTWVNVNYLLIEGLRKSGNALLADELRNRTLGLINAQPDIYEYYNPETGLNPPNAASVFGWSSAVFIDLAIQASREK